MRKYTAASALALTAFAMGCGVAAGYFWTELGPLLAVLP